MNQKIGRNDPCPCGSGKKYKHCCGKPEAPASDAAESSAGAVERAIAWLAQHHRKAWAEALNDTIQDAAFEIIEDEEEALAALDGIDDELWQQILVNLTEWLLAEGDILVKGRHQRVAELLLGPRGPLLATGQRAWLEQLARQPLRLYDVTEVVVGESITLCDAVATERPPFVVSEREGSRSLRVGMQIGARVMVAGARHQLSGAIYGFSSWAGRGVQERLRDLLRDSQAEQEEGEPEQDENDILLASLEIIESWLEQHLLPAPLPQIVHSSTGEPLLLTTDYYDVLDWDALTAALAAQPDVQGDRVAGWGRLIDGADGLTRSQATITPTPRGQRVSVLYQTAGLAEGGRGWFDALAGDSVKFRLQEVSDPRGMLSSRAGASAAGLGQGPEPPAGLDPETMFGVMESVIRKMYANWAAEPIPALSGQTPRQAIKTPAGLERVKGLLRSYEDGEARQAAQQGRREVSYQFLWDALGLTR